MSRPLEIFAHNYSRSPMAQHTSLSSRSRSCQQLDQCQRVRLTRSSRRCLHGEDTSCSPPGAFAAADDATAASSTGGEMPDVFV